MRSVDDLGIDFEAGEVVVEVSPKRKRDGSLEWTYRFWRKYDFNGECKTAFFFRREHNEMLGRAMVYAFNWMNENDPEKWVRAQRSKAA